MCASVSTLTSKNLAPVRFVYVHTMLITARQNHLTKFSLETTCTLQLPYVPLLITHVAEGTETVLNTI